MKSELILQLSAEERQTLTTRINTLSQLLESLRANREADNQLSRKLGQLEDELADAGRTVDPMDDNAHIAIAGKQQQVRSIRERQQALTVEMESTAERLAAQMTGSRADLVAILRQEHTALVEQIAGVLRPFYRGPVEAEQQAKTTQAAMAFQHQLRLPLRYNSGEAERQAPELIAKLEAAAAGQNPWAFDPQM